jgi:hypothetical protein
MSSHEAVLEGSGVAGGKGWMRCSRRASLMLVLRA